MIFPDPVYWPALVGALVLLWFPPSLWLRKKIKRHLSHPGAAGEFRLRRGATLWQNWVDLPRGFIGCTLLVYSFGEAPEGEEWAYFGWLAVVLLISLYIQTVRRFRKKTFFLAPITFIWGITFVLVAPLLAIYGIVASVIVSNVAENLEWKLPIMAGVIAIAGYFLGDLGRPLLLNLIVIIFPLIVALCGGGRLAFLMPEEKRK